MSNGYRVAYRIGVAPQERSRTDAAASIGALLDREADEHSPSLGRALDLGCGRGGYTVDLARRGVRGGRRGWGPQGLTERGE